jgi:glycerol kinase
MLYNIRERRFDDVLLEALRIPRALLPDVRESSGVLGETEPGILGAALPVAGMAGDQQAALFGQGCLRPGSGKNTYGTGCFLLVNTGGEAPRSKSGLVTTIAWSRGGQVDYALEGSVFVAGAAVQWLRDGLRVLSDAAESEAAARAVEDTAGVYVVPAFVGLGAPYWDEAARGTIVGITRGTTREHLIRATLESIAYQTRDVVECVRQDAALPVGSLRVDGGACRNDFLMQFQADVLGVPVLRPPMLEVTALGAAALAGLGVGFWQDASELESATSEGMRVFEPRLGEAEREEGYAGWRRAVERARGWARG